MSDFFGQVEKQLDKKANGNFKIYDVINWEINNCAISPEVNANRQIGQLIEYNMRNILPKNHNRFVNLVPSASFRYKRKAKKRRKIF